MPFKDLADSIKNIVGSVREAAIILVIVVIFFFHGVTARYIARVAADLNQAGTGQGSNKTEVDLGVVKYTFEKSTEVKASLNSANSADEDSLKLLEHVKTLVKSPQAIAQIEEAEKSVRASKDQVAASLAATASIQLKNDQAIQTSPNATSGPFGIVVAADRMREHAEYEVHLLKRKGFTNIAVFQRQGLYRTVARFPDKASAAAQLDAIHAYRPDAYLIDLSTWCQSSSPSNDSLEGVNVTNCQ
jgi:hypothetical protein